MAKTTRTKLEPSNSSNEMFTTEKVNEIMAVVFPRVKASRSAAEIKEIKEELNYIARGAQKASEFGELRQSLDQAEAPVNKIKRQMERLLTEIRSLAEFEKAPRVFECKINNSLNENPRLGEKAAIRFPCIAPTKEENPFAGDDEDSSYLDFSPLKMLDDVQSKIEVIAECLAYQRQVPKCPDDGTHREKKNDKLFDTIVRDLCFIWVNTLGEEVKTSTVAKHAKLAKDEESDVLSGNSKTESSGPLVRFIAEFCKQLDISKTNSAIQEAIKKSVGSKREYKAHRRKRIEQAIRVDERLGDRTGHGE